MEQKVRLGSLHAYSLNNLTEKPNSDGSYTLRFGGCTASTVNCLPIMDGWNYSVRMYEPSKAPRNILAPYNLRKFRDYREFWAKNRIEGYALYTPMVIPLGAELRPR